MIEMEAVVFGGEHVEADRAVIFDGGVGHVRSDEFRPHRQDVAPAFDPALGITPVTFCGVRDFTENIGMFRLGANDVHLL